MLTLLSGYPGKVFMTYLRDYSWAAGGFYPTDARECELMIEKCMSGKTSGDIELPEPIAGIVPHAGWVYSGPTAGKVFRAFHEKKSKPEIAICFGSVHVPGVRKPNAIRSGEWRTPLGNLPVNSGFSDKIFDMLGSNVTESNHPHEEEHSIEVVLPFLKKIFPDISIVPILVPPDDYAAVLGKELGGIAASYSEEIIFLGSSDLTHYGSRFGFTPAGRGAGAVEWCKKENDGPLLEMALTMNAEEVVSEARSNHSACGAGAIAATVAAARELGKKKGMLLEHTTSYDVKPDQGADSFVGYAGIIY